MTPEQLREGLFQARRIIRAAVGFRFAGEVVEFSPIFRSLALRAVDTLEAAALVSPRVETAPSSSKLDEIAALQDGWDSYGARRIDGRAIESARCVVAALAQPPSIVPTTNGGIQLEWHDHDVDVELAITPAGGREFSLLADPEEDTTPRVETEGDAARERLRKAIRFEWGRRESDSWAWALIEEAFDLIPKPRPSGWYHEADEKLYEATMSEPPSIPLVANAAIPPGEVHVKVDGKTVAKIVGLDLSSRPPVDPKEGT